MNRRSFFRLGFGGLATTATMSEAGALAEFMSWLTRKPAWSFPTLRPEREYFFKYNMLFDEIGAVTRNHIRQSIVYDQFFADRPLAQYLRSQDALIIRG